MPQTMRAIALDHFGGPELLVEREIPVPPLGPHDVLISVHTAGVGVWDPFEVQGGFAKMFELTPRFPFVPGFEGSGTIARVGPEVRDVRGLRVGDQVYGARFLNPGTGFYAEYAVMDADYVSPLPGDLDFTQAAGVGGVGITALCGLRDALELKAGESLMIFGASGGIGHVAVQLARRMGARVFAVASGADGKALAEQLGADAVVDGHRDDVLAAARDFAPGGLDAALLTSGGPAATAALQALRDGGRAAFPNGVESEPQPREGVRLTSFDGDVRPETIAALNRMIESGPFRVHVARSFPLARAAEAHQALQTHYLGKLVLRVG